MDPRTLDATFQEFARTAGMDLDTSVPAVGIPAMLRFYRDRRVDGCDFGDDADMLLFQWGTYDWGSGNHFELDLTRQVILPDEEDDDAIWQLHLTYRFLPSDELKSLGSGDRWCSAPDQVSIFEEWINSTPAYSTVARRAPQSVLVQFECAG
ncbi:MAG TPA: hypothetical protein VLB12_00860 [Gemmatimonadales bacterium]|nr:hypothetical protein [Gemmatimonadales bacterium]